MKVNLHIKSEFDSVYLANGVFQESADNIAYDENVPIYMTVLPLKATLLPYTVKIIDGKIFSNEELASSYRLGNNHFFIKLKQRSNYVYSPSKDTVITPTDNVMRFFLAVKCGELSTARTYLTPSLSSSIDDASLSEFFSDFIDIVDNTFTSTFGHTYYLIDSNHNGSLFQFTLTQSLIDNMIEMTSQDLY